MDRTQSRIRYIYHRLMKSIQGPTAIPASYIGLAERDEWIRSNHMLRVHEATEKGPIAPDEIIRILGNNYDSLEALLSITIPTTDDRLRGTPIVKDDITYNTTPEITLVSLFHAENAAAYRYGRLLLAAIRAEKDHRNQEDYLGRSKGFCCATAQYQSRRAEKEKGKQKADGDRDGRKEKTDSGYGKDCGCEKLMPEAWEIGRSVL